MRSGHKKVTSLSNFVSFGFVCSGKKNLGLLMDILELFYSIFSATAKFSTKCDGQSLLQSATLFITLRQEVQSANNITNCDSTPVHGHGGENALHLRKYRLNPGCHKNDSLYTDVVLLFFSFFSKTLASEACEASARERIIKNVCRHLWEKEFY